MEKGIGCVGRWTEGWRNGRGRGRKTGGNVSWENRGAGEEQIKTEVKISVDKNVKESAKRATEVMGEGGGGGGRPEEELDEEE